MKRNVKENCKGIKNFQNQIVDSKEYLISHVFLVY